MKVLWKEVLDVFARRLSTVEEVSCDMESISGVRTKDGVFRAYINNYLFILFVYHRLDLKGQNIGYYHITFCKNRFEFFIYDGGF